MFYEIETYHYLLIHFPISLFIVGYLFDCMDCYKKNVFYEKFSDMNMLLGVVFGFFTIVSGFYADNLVGHMENPFPVWSTHGTHMIISFFLFLILLLYKNYKPNRRYTIFLHTVILLFFIHGAHIGAKLADRF